MELLSDPSVWLSFATLAVLEIVLGIDNIIFISIVASRLPKEQQAMARNLGLGLALAIRIALLFSLAWLMQLTEPVVTLFELELSWRDLIFLVGGIFLLAKATMEIYATAEGDHGHTTKPVTNAAMGMAILQIVALDVVFSFDSVLTALGLTEHIPVIIAAVVLAMGVMVFGAKAVSEFVDKHLSVKILALAFLLVIGVVLVADGLHVHIPKPYVYSALAFSMFVQILTLWVAGRRKA